MVKKKEIDKDVLFSEYNVTYCVGNFHMIITILLFIIMAGFLFTPICNNFVGRPIGWLFYLLFFIYGTWTFTRIIEIENDGIYVYSWRKKRLLDYIAYENISNVVTEVRNHYADGTIIRQKRNEKDNQYGCHGVRLYYNNGDEIFIGSNKKAELLSAINKAIHNKQISSISPNPEILTK